MVDRHNNLVGTSHQGIMDIIGCVVGSVNLQSRSVEVAGLLKSVMEVDLEALLLDVEVKEAKSDDSSCVPVVEILHGFGGIFFPFESGGQPNVLCLSDSWHEAGDDHWVELAEALLFKSGHVSIFIFDFVSVVRLRPEVLPSADHGVADILLPVELNGLDCGGHLTCQKLKIICQQNRPDLRQTSCFGSNLRRQDYSRSELNSEVVTIDVSNCEMSQDHEASVESLLEKLSLRILSKPLTNS